MRTPCAISLLLIWPLVNLGCRSAVIVTPKDENAQTIVTVEHRPTTNPSDKGLIVREKP